MARMDGSRRTHYARDLIAGKALGLIVAEALRLPDDMLDAAEQAGLAVFASPLPAGLVIDRLRVYLNKKLAAHCTMHGVFMDVLGMGVLIAGESGVGKSELGLELISRGHGLVADDVVDFARTEPDSIEGHCPPLLANLLEVRGLGLLDIRSIFGETAVRRKMKLRLIVELRRQAAAALMERLPLAGTTEEVLGLPVHKVVIPVAAGRNLAVLLEAAVRNTILKLRGIDTMADFIQRQRQAIDHG
jgi:HPr kinase/phosphorylase